MDLPAQIGLGVGSLVATTVLCRFFYVAMEAPEQMNLGLANGALPKGWGARLYLGLVVLSWLAFTYSGAQAILFWLFGGEAVMFASFMALLSVQILIHVERSAYLLTNYRRTLTVREKLEQFITYATTPSQADIESYREKATSAETLEDRGAYQDIARMAAALAERDAKLGDYAVEQYRRKAARQAGADTNGGDNVHP